jgi:hypothetical protein
MCNFSFQGIAMLMHYSYSKSLVYSADRKNKTKGRQIQIHRYHNGSKGGSMVLGAIQ